MVMLVGYSIGFTLMAETLRNQGFGACSRSGAPARATEIGG